MASTNPSLNLPNGIFPLLFPSFLICFYLSEVGLEFLVVELVECVAVNCVRSGLFVRRIIIFVPVSLIISRLLVYTDSISVEGSTLLFHQG